MYSRKIVIPHPTKYLPIFNEWPRDIRKITRPILPVSQIRRSSICSSRFWTTAWTRRCPSTWDSSTSSDVSICTCVPIYAKSKSNIRDFHALSRWVVAAEPSEFCVMQSWILGVLRGAVFLESGFLYWLISFVGCSAFWFFFVSRIVSFWRWLGSRNRGWVKIYRAFCET